MKASKDYGGNQLRPVRVEQRFPRSLRATSRPALVRAEQTSGEESTGLEKAEKKDVLPKVRETSSAHQ